MDRLEALNIIPDTTDDEDGLVIGGEIHDEDHIRMTGEDVGGVEGPDSSSSRALAATQRPQSLVVRRMQNRGVPYFEEMVENSKLGRIKRQKGGHTSRDGRTTVQWEVVEIGGDEPTSTETTAESEGDGDSSNKRQKMDA